jgi:spore maturation protein CgeB
MISGSMSQPTHIAVVGPIAGGSLSIAEACVRALRRLGHRVTFVDNQGYAPALRAIDAATIDASARARARVDLFLVASDATRRALREARPQLALFLAQAPVVRDSDVDDLRAANIPSVFWFVEDFRVFTYWPSAVRRFDHVWTIQRGELHQRLAAAGHRSFDYVPTACDPELHHPYSPDETRDYAAAVSFAGSAYPNRRKLLSDLCALGLGDEAPPVLGSPPAFRLWGPRFSREPALAAAAAAGLDGDVPHAALARIFSATAINLNLSSSAAPETFAIAKDLVNPRTFEIAGCGGFQLAESLIPIGEFFEPGREIEIFTTVAEARDKLRYYRAHEAARRAVAEAGHRRAHAEHTYDRRLAAALARLAERDDRIASRAAGDRP